MTEQQYYGPAEEMIAKIQAAGKDPYKKALDYLTQAKKNGEFSFTLKKMNSTETIFDLVIKRIPTGYNIVYANYPEVTCLEFSFFAFQREKDMAKQLTKELIAMAYCSDIAIKQYSIDVCRAQGMDV